MKCNSCTVASQGIQTTSFGPVLHIQQLVLKCSLVRNHFTQLSIWCTSTQGAKNVLAYYGKFQNWMKCISCTVASQGIQATRFGPVRFSFNSSFASVPRPGTNSLSFFCYMSIQDLNICAFPNGNNQNLMICITWTVASQGIQATSFGPVVHIQELVSKYSRFRNLSFTFNS